MARFAENIDERTHRYPSNIMFGRGYFGDLFKSVVAESDEDALVFMTNNTGGGNEPFMLQKIENGAWSYAYPMVR